MAAVRALPQRALRIYEAEIERLHQQRQELRGDLEKLLAQYSQPEPRAGVDPELAKLAGDLRTALAAANEKRRLSEEKFQAFEFDALREEDRLRHELQQAQMSVEVVRDRHEAASQRAQGELLRAEIRSAELERDAALRAAAELEIEIAPRATDSIEEDVADAAAVDALGPDAVESMLRAEADALRTALKFYREQRQTAAHAKATMKAEEALQRREEAQREEAASLQAVEERVRVGRAVVQDALESTLGRPTDDTEAGCAEASNRVAALEASCEKLKQSLVPLQEQHAHLQWLRRAAESRISELEERFASLRISTEQIVKVVVEEMEMEGVPALIEILLRIAGTPRIAFLVIDGNHNGRVSMTELDTSLRQRLFLDYKIITGLSLRAVFKAFDTSHQGVISECDFCMCCAKYQALASAAPQPNPVESPESPAQAPGTPRFG